jgi:hypothetical protein
VARRVIFGKTVRTSAGTAKDGLTGASWFGSAPAWSLADVWWCGAVFHRSGDGVSFTDCGALTTTALLARAKTVLLARERCG